MDPEKTIDVETAKDELEEAEENLERAEVHEEIERVKDDAQLAIDIAADASHAAAIINEELREQTEVIEENSEWQTRQIHALTTQMDSLREELLILKASQNPAPLETPEAPEPLLVVEPDETILPETTKETSSETPTEARKENVDESQEPAIQAVLNPQRKIRLV